MLLRNIILLALTSITVLGSCPQRDIVASTFTDTSFRVFTCSSSDPNKQLPSSICQGSLTTFTLSFWFQAQTWANLSSEHTIFRLTMDDTSSSGSYRSRMFLLRIVPQVSLININICIGKNGDNTAQIYTPTPWTIGLQLWNFVMFSVDYPNNKAFAANYDVNNVLGTVTGASGNIDQSLDWKIDDAVKMYFGGDNFYAKFTSYYVRELHFFPNYYSENFAELAFSYPSRLIATFNLYQIRSGNIIESVTEGTLSTPAACTKPVWNDLTQSLQMSPTNCLRITHSSFTNEIPFLTSSFYFEMKYDTTLPVPSPTCTSSIIFVRKRADGSNIFSFGMVGNSFYFNLLTQGWEVPGLYPSDNKVHQVYLSVYLKDFHPGFYLSLHIDGALVYDDVYRGPGAPLSSSAVEENSDDIIQLGDNTCGPTAEITHFTIYQGAIYSGGEYNCISNCDYTIGWGSDQSFCASNTCGEQEFFDQKTHSCASCDASCNGCHAAGEFACKQCLPGYQFDTTPPTPTYSCISKCYIFLQVELIIIFSLEIPCSLPGCQLCTDASTCIVCYQGYSQNQSTCELILAFKMLSSPLIPSSSTTDKKYRFDFSISSPFGLDLSLTNSTTTDFSALLTITTQPIAVNSIITDILSDQKTFNFSIEFKPNETADAGVTIDARFSLVPDSNSDVPYTFQNSTSNFPICSMIALLQF